jgi:hypothetical protein
MATSEGAAVVSVTCVVMVGPFGYLYRQAISPEDYGRAFGVLVLLYPKAARSAFWSCLLQATARRAPVKPFPCQSFARQKWRKQ